MESSSLESMMERFDKSLSKIVLGSAAKQRDELVA